jgi:hypothetical protein
MAKKKATTSTPDEPDAPKVSDTLGSNDGDDDMSDAYESASGKKRTDVIQHIIMLCGFGEDTIMVRYIDQQHWTDLFHVISIDVDEVKDFHTVRDDGITFEAKPMLVHLRVFKAFLLYYKRRSREHPIPLSEAHVLLFSKLLFREYCCSDEYTEDLKACGANPSPPMVKSSPGISGIVGSLDSLTVQEFRRGVKRDKTHYEDLKDDKYFSSWNRGFVATARMHHTDLVLDENYIPKTDEEKFVFKEMQIFMYAVLEDHLKTGKGKSLVSQYEDDHDAQSIYRELKKHALSSTAAQLSGDTLLQYITTTRYPGNWRGTSHEFVLHWKEQVMRYERLELEPFPPKQKLRMLQNAVGDVTELAYVKQIGDQDIARGYMPLNYESYMELLLSACSTYDKKITLPGKQKRAVYTTMISEDDQDPYYDTTHDEGYAVYNIDTDISDIMVNATSTSRFGSNTSYGKETSTFLPREEWNKLTQEQKDRLIAKRRQERMTSNNGNHKPFPSQRQANVHGITDLVDLDDIIDYAVMNHDVGISGDDGDNKESVESNDELLAFMAGRETGSAGDIRHVLAAKRAPDKNKNRKVNESKSAPSTVQVGNTTYYLNKGETITFQGYHYSAHMTMVNYRVSQHDVTSMEHALVDRGANGGICGSDMVVLEGSERFVDVFGLAGHKVSQLRIVTAQALVTTHKGEAIATFHQMALLGKGKSILSCLQIEAYGANINDRSRLLPGGKQRILIDGYQLPLDFKNGLAYLRCRKPNEEEVRSLPHIIMTADVDWDPSLYDNDIVDLEKFHDTSEDENEEEHFNQYGEYRHRTVATHTTTVPEEEFFDTLEYNDFDDMVDDLIDSVNPKRVSDVYDINVTDVNQVKTNFELLRPLFGWAPAETIKRTFDVTTQYARGRVSDTLKQHWRSRFPACNVKRRNEPVATDTVFSDTPAVDCGVTAAQIFVGRESLVADVYGLKTDKEFVNTLEDNIRERGAMDKLISDCAKAEMSNRVKQILRALCISSWYSEPYHENQNFAENRYGSIKAGTNRVMNFSGAPANTWLLALIYVCLLLNHLASAALGWKSPEQVLTGQTPDISKFMHFSFYEPVYYHAYSDTFPSATNEEQGWWVGIATHVGDALTYKILTKNNKVIYRSAVRSALDHAKRNQRLSPLGGETASNYLGDKMFIRSKFPSETSDQP